MANSRDEGALRIALVGTRGVPASYGGFETAVEEIGQRLALRGHHVTVYGRDAGAAGPVYLGMQRVTLPAIKRKSLETLSHTALSTVHAVARGKPDVAVLFNAANSPLIPVLRAAKTPVALHVDGLEWKRSKWGKVGRTYYRRAELLGVRFADALIADSPGIADYYKHQFAASTELIAYGAPLLTEAPVNRIEGMGLVPGGYHLVVARFEPENHVYEIVQGFSQSDSSRQLVVVGAAPYSEDYTRAIEQLATNDSRIRLVGSIYDQELLDTMYFYACTYVHGHSVGGTNPSLLRAIGAGTPVVAYDVSFNRDVLGANGWFFRDPTSLAEALHQTERFSGLAELGSALRAGAAERYTWDGVTDLYENLLYRLAGGELAYGPRWRVSRNREEWAP